MRLASDSDALRWLLSKRGQESDFDWDAGNRDKSRKHGIASHEIETIIRGDFYFAGRIVEPRHDEPRWLVLGENMSGRKLALVLTRRGDKVRPISCRPMRRRKGRSMSKPLKRKTVRRRADAQLREFASRDLGDDIAGSGAGRMVRRSRTTSISLDEGLIEKLRVKGEKRGLGYQTMLKLIVSEHVDDY